MTGSGISSKEQHAVLSPSASERWLACPASIRMSALVPPQPETSYAREGTIAHALLEIEGRAAFGKITPAQHVRERNAWRAEWEVDEDAEEEMSVHVEACIDLLKVKMENHPGSVILFEQRLPTGVPSCWGTSDVVMLSPIHVEIVDLKYGKGVRVEAKGNSQLRLYGVGALEGLADMLGEPETVIITVMQPRLNHYQSEVLTADELRDWRDSIIPTAEIALGDDAPFGPGVDVCRWCPAAGQCRAQMEWATAQDFGTSPDLMSPADMSAALDVVDELAEWVAAVRSVAMDQIYSQGTRIPGYKVVRTNGRRSIPDSESAINALLENGRWKITDISNRKIKGIGDLEKLLGKEEFSNLLDPYVIKSEGNPALVPEDDDRPSINPTDEAIKEFE